uniref:Uncharacterized protein n=1 Tax=Oryctolagus cuniculus TaxID=9986 RepID=A0A5F9D076_RABIT
MAKSDPKFTQYLISVLQMLCNDYKSETTSDQITGRTAVIRHGIDDLEINIRALMTQARTEELAGENQRAQGC